MMPDFAIIMDPIATVETPWTPSRRLTRLNIIYMLHQERDVAKLLASFNDIFGETIFQRIHEFVGKEYFTVDLILNID